jgi:hypothetical protein
MAAADVSGQGLPEERNEEGKTDDCVVCLQQTLEKSSQLFLYNCRCVYAIHASCFRDWRRMTETNRICLICREGLESFEERDDEERNEERNEVVLRRRALEGVIADAHAQAFLAHPIPLRPNYGVFRRWLHRIDNAHKNICLAGFFVCLILVVFRLLLGDPHSKVTPPPDLRPLGQGRLLL